MEGEDRIKERGSLYLPEPDAMNPVQYRRYKTRANFYGVAERTVRGLVGLVFRIEPTFDLPPVLSPLLNSATPTGMPLSTLTADVLRDVVSLGRYGVLVDMPRSPSLIGSAVPYLAPYTAENIWRWEESFDPVSGVRKLTRVVVREDAIVERDLEKTYLRELFLDPSSGNYTQQFWVEVNDETATSVRLSDGEVLANGSFDKVGPPIVPVVSGQPLKKIPFFFLNTFNLQPKTDRPPMLDLASVNVAHYRNSADLEHALYLTSQPTPVITGWTTSSDKPAAIGSGTIWFLPTGTDAKYLEFEGKGVGALRQAMQDKESRMAALGARMIRDLDRSNVTAEATRMQMTAETSVLVSAVGNVERGMEAALRMAAEWAGADPDEVDVSLNHDLVDASLSSLDLNALVQAWMAGAISGPTLHANLQRGEIIDPKKSYEDEQAEIEEQAPDAPLPSPPDDQVATPES
jgi:hypothetical protein